METLKSGMEKDFKFVHCYECVPQTVHSIFSLKTKRKLKTIPIFDFLIKTKIGFWTDFRFFFKIWKTDFKLEILGKIREALGLVGRYSIHRREPTHSSSRQWHSIFVWFFDSVVKMKIDYFPNFVFSKKRKLIKFFVFLFF